MRRSPLLLTSALTALALGAPVAAHAATITSDGAGHYTYTAAPGEQNQMSLQFADDGTSVVFYDYGIPVTVPASCTPDDAGQSPTCAAPASVAVILGDGDDSFNRSGSEAIPTVVDGGPGADWMRGTGTSVDVFRGGDGNDRLETYKGDDAIDGGEGDDRIDAGAGTDSVQGGGGNDTISPDGYTADPAPDTVDGGPGVDTVESDYAAPDTSSPPPILNFTMAGGADDGRPGENDSIANVERLYLSVSPAQYVGTDGDDFIKVAQSTNPGNISGGAGNDDLSGADGMETVDGGPGNDRVVGGFNDDVLTGGPGRDQIIGDLPTGDCGPLWCKYPFGNDTIYAQDGEVDTISCGWGTDTVYADAADVVDKDCETVNRAGATPAPPATTPSKTTTKGKSTTNADGGPSAKAALAGRVTLAKALKAGFTVKVTGVEAGTTLKLSATRAGRVVARGSGKATKKGTATVKLRFTSKARKSLRRAKSITLKVTGAGVAGTVTLKRR